MHFNIEYSGHVPGKIYGLIKILGKGFFDGKNEIIPLLDDEIIKVKCVSARERVSYDDLGDLSHSLPNMRTPSDVKKVILYRYKYLSVTEEELVKLGVAITNLEKVK